MEILIEISRFLHSWTRWLLLIVVVVALGYFLLQWLQNGAWTKRAQTLLTVFSSLIGTQWLLGILLLVVYGSQTSFGQRHFWEHLFTQTIALFVAHLHFMWRRRQFTDRIRYRNGLLLIIAVLVLIMIGIVVLPQGIQWRFYVPS